MASFELFYFDIRGLAEPLRLMFAVSGTPWKDTLLGRSPEGLTHEWNAFKAANSNTDALPYGQLPILKVTEADGTTQFVSQSLAIIRFLARRFKLAADGSEADVIRSDELASALQQTRGAYGKLAYNEAALSEAQLVADHRAYMDAQLALYARQLKVGGGQFLVGGKLSYVDVLALDMLESSARLHAGLLDKHPEMLAYVQRLMAVPAINAFLRDPKRRTFANGNNAALDTPVNAPAATLECPALP